MKPKSVFPLFMVLLLFWNAPAMAQFPPPTGVEGSTAIKADSSIFVDWASAVEIQRGWMNIADTAIGVASYGVAEDALDAANNAAVSLGDKGQITCYFDVPLANGLGWDFAVFENSFDDAFLELAFVEVSSNGADFVRFPAVSYTSTEEQISTFGTIDATHINLLAGKYRGGFGVPFDLEVLKSNSKLDVNHVVAVRIVDVVGCVQTAFASFDSNGNTINDPWPTPFETGGFDLDAIGVIHNQNNTSINEMVSALQLNLFPNPANDVFSLSANIPITQMMVLSTNGQVVWYSSDYFGDEVRCSDWPPGLYVVRCLVKEVWYNLKMIKQ